MADTVFSDGRMAWPRNERGKTVARTKVYEGKVLPTSDAKAAYDAANALHESVWADLVALRDGAQAVLNRVSEAKANALADYVASRQAEERAK
jgi:hypothetical protein